MFNKYIYVAALLTIFLPSCSAQKAMPISDLNKEESWPTFVEAHKDFPREEKNLRKWDAPVVADLDQDGQSDLILNDHGFGIRICWNNKGKFSKPYDLIMGDLHGVTVGDYDKDGNLELVISRGGGSGSNARNSKIYRAHKDRTFEAIPDFTVPLELMRGRTVKLIDGDNDGHLDLLNFAFPDKDRNGESENYIYKNNGQGEMILHAALPFTERDGQKTLVTDINSDNVLDIILYGHESVKVFEGNGDLTYTEVSNQVLVEKITHVTGIVELDFDNDGDFDLFMTRGKEFVIGETFYDADTKDWGFYTKRGKFDFGDLVLGDVINLYNFQSQWPDNDAYHIGETGYPYEFEGETHSGKEIRLVNSDALGFPDKMTEKGIYVGYVGNLAWKIAGNTWAPTTGTVPRVESYPAFKHERGLNDLLLENNSGKFRDVTEKYRLDNAEHTTGATVADFNNDGRQDILVMKRGDLIHQNEALLYVNNGSSGFSEAKNHNIISTEKGAIGMGVGTIDYNQDGAVDVVIGNERGLWHLFTNTISPSRYLTVDVGSSKKGCSALGALVEISGCGMKQIQRIGTTGACYSLSHDTSVHFGLGKCKDQLTVKVIWSTGETESIQTKTSRAKLGH